MITSTRNDQESTSRFVEYESLNLINKDSYYQLNTHAYNIVYRVYDSFFWFNGSSSAPLVSRLRYACGLATMLTSQEHTQRPFDFSLPLALLLLTPSPLEFDEVLAAATSAVDFASGSNLKKSGKLNCKKSSAGTMSESKITKNEAAGWKML